MGAVKTSLSGVTTALEGIQGGNLEGLGGSVSGLNQPLGEAQAGLTGLQAGLEGLDSSALIGIGEAAATLDEEFVFPQAQDAFNTIGESWEAAIPYLADLEEQAVADYLQAQNAFADITESWENTVPRLEGFGAAFEVFKADLFAQGRKGLDQINAGLETIGQNSALTAMAGHLSNAAGSFEAFSGKINDLINEPSKLAATFDASMRNIQSLMGNVSGEALTVIKNKLREIGSSAAAGPNAVAEAFYNITSGVGNAAVRMDTLTAAVKLAESGQAALGAATSGLISVVNAYGTSAENMGGLTDVFFQTVRKGVGSLDGFVSSMSSIAGLSANVGIGFDELGSAMAFVTAKGQTESVAATQLKAAVTTLLNPNKELSEALQAVGISSGSAMLKEYGLAESLNIVKQAVGGSQDKMAKALGSTEALQAALVLAADDYTNFAQAFSADLGGAAAGGLAAQVESYESKMARLQAASDGLKTKIGLDINGIKGFFADMQTGFLQNVVSPLLNSPVGGVFSHIAAVVSVGASQMLNMGSVALNTAAQMTTLAANIKNAGGYLQILKGTMTVLAAPFHGIAAAARSAGTGLAGMGTSIVGLLPKMGAWIASTWAAAAANIAAFWPVYAVIAGIALLAAGAVLLVKHWGTVKAFFVNVWNTITGVFSTAFNRIGNTLAGVSDGVLGAIAVFLPFIGIPALIIKHWDAIGAFFAGLWNKIPELFRIAIEGIKSIFMKIPNWVVGLLAVFFPFISIPVLIISRWDVIQTFFAGLWESIKSVTGEFVSLLGSIWDAAVTRFVSVWNGIPAFFSSLGQSIIGIIRDVVNWINGVWTSVVSGFTTAWNAVYTFFVSLWNGLVTLVLGVVNLFMGLWTQAASGFTIVWTYGYTFFSGIWNGMAGVVSGFANLLTGIWETVVSVFIVAWGYVYTYFGGIWEGIKSVVLGFIEWLGGAAAFIIAPFLKVAEVVGGVLNGIGGFFKRLLGDGDSAGKAMEENLRKSVSGTVTVAEPVINTPPAAAPQSAKPVLDTIKAQEGKGVFGGKPDIPAAAITQAAPPVVPAALTDMQSSITPTPVVLIRRR